MLVPKPWNNEKTEEEMAFFTSGYLGLIFCFQLKSKHVHKRYRQTYWLHQSVNIEITLVILTITLVQLLFRLHIVSSNK